MARPRPRDLPTDSVAPRDDAPPPDPTADEASERAPERLAAELGLTFKDIDLLRLALTHRSVIHDWSAAAPDLPPPSADRQSNERLEFLGDSVLGYIAADYLYHRYPDAPEGLLTAKRVSLVRAERLVRWAREIRLADYLYLGQGEKVTEGARDRMLAGAFEALVGAIALDKGLREARRFLRRFIVRDEAEMLAELAEANPKGRLQEILQEKYRTPPAYRTLSEEGPAHARTFTAEVSINGEALGVGSGSSKRDAEQAAAIVALTALQRPRPQPAPSQISTNRRRKRRP